MWSRSAGCACGPGPLQGEGDLAYPFLLDERGLVRQAYGVNGIPRMFLIGLLTDGLPQHESRD